VEKKKCINYAVQFLFYLYMEDQDREECRKERRESYSTYIPCIPAPFSMRFGLDSISFFSLTSFIYLLLADLTGSGALFIIISLLTFDQIGRHLYRMFSWPFGLFLFLFVVGLSLSLYILSSFYIFGPSVARWSYPHHSLFCCCRLCLCIYHIDMLAWSDSACRVINQSFYASRVLSDTKYSSNPSIHLYDHRKINGAASWGERAWHHCLRTTCPPRRPWPIYCD